MTSSVHQAAALFRQLERSQRAVDRESASVKRLLAQGTQDLMRLAKQLINEHEQAWNAKLAAQLSMVRHLSSQLSDPASLARANMQVLQLKGELRDVKEELAATSLALSRSQAECAALRRSVKSPSAPPQPAEAAQAQQRQPRRVQGSGTPHPSHASQRAQASRLAQPRCKPAQHTSEAATPKAATRRQGGRLAARRKARHPSAASSSTAPAKPPAAASREAAAAPALSRQLPRRRKCRRKGEGAKLREKAKRLSPSGEERAPPRDVSSRPPLAQPTGPSKLRSSATPPPPPPLAARAQSPEAMQEAPLSVQHLRQAYERLKLQAQAHDVRAGRLRGMAERPGVEEEQGPDPIRTFSLD